MGKRRAIVRLADLIPAERNPHKHTASHIEALVGSIERHGFLEGIVVDGKDELTLIDGHARVEALIANGYEQLEVTVLDEEEKAERDATNIALDVTYGLWDDPVLKSMLEDLDNSHYDLDYTGLPEGQWKRLLREDMEITILREDAKTSNLHVVFRVEDQELLLAFLGRTMLPGDLSTAVKRRMRELVAAAQPEPEVRPGYSGPSTVDFELEARLGANTEPDLSRLDQPLALDHGA